MSDCQASTVHLRFGASGGDEPEALELIFVTASDIAYNPPSSWPLGSTNATFPGSFS
jgi:hypothetical protein